jgi:uncharacterized protein (TIGR00730 family)
MRSFRRLCVFCGSSPGARPEYREAAQQMGRLLAERKIGLVYGGGNVGLMGAVADAAIAAGGEVIGVIPGHLEARELAHHGLTELRVVSSMHERKALMAELSDAFIALPGGLGTLDELFEMLTWTQLGIHRKPCALLDVNGYFEQLGVFLDHAVSQRFIKAEHRSMLIAGTDPEALLEQMLTTRLPEVSKWMAPGKY